MDTDTFYSAETDLFLNLSQALFLPEESIQVWSIITAQSPARYFFKGYIYYFTTNNNGSEAKGQCVKTWVL